MISIEGGGFHKVGVSVREQRKTDIQTAGDTKLVRELKRKIVVATYRKIEVADECPDVEFPPALSLTGAPGVGAVLDRRNSFNTVTGELVTEEDRVVFVVGGGQNDGWTQVASHVVTEEVD